MSQPAATFASKIDAWLAALLLGSAAVVLVIVVSSWRPAAATAAVPIAALALGAGLPLWILAATSYRVEGADLLIRSGPLRGRIAVRDIQRITPSLSWLSAPALSLDRLCIHYGRTTGRMRQALVSPRDRQGFVQALRRPNPDIEIQGL